MALDVFGDLDTLMAASRWMPIGRPENASIDPEMLLAALHALSRSDAASAWIAGGGLDGMPDVLSDGSKLLPLIGTAAQHVRQIKDAKVFFDVLSACGIDHPPVCHDMPDPPAGWLIKDAHGSGGQHIRLAEVAVDQVSPSSSYFQQRVDGSPMSATFLANGHDVAILGFNQLMVRSIGGCPYVFCGAIGPVPVSTAVRQSIGQALAKLTPALHLKGLCSLDFILDGDRSMVLEINPRPPASMALYMAAAHHMSGDGLMAAHCLACTTGELPQWARSLEAACQVSGFEVMYAPHAIDVTEADITAWSAIGTCHDVPSAALHVEAGQPVCTVSAQGGSVQQVQQQLAQRLTSLLPQ